jgi:hypothetical protein
MDGLPSLEEIVSRNRRLSIIHQKDLVNSLPLNNPDTTVGYLISTLSYLQDLGIEEQGFLMGFSEYFKLGGLPQHLQSPNRWTNRWIYRSFVEAARELTRDDPEKFYREIFARSFSDKDRNLIIATSRYLDFGSVMARVSSKTKDFTRLISMRSELEGKGRMVIYRSSDPQHVQELKEHFGEEEAQVILREDCLSTYVSLGAVRGLFGDPKSRIYEHKQCEVDGAKKCVYHISFTPVSWTETLNNVVLSALSWVIPPLKRKLHLMEELREGMFRLGAAIEDERAYSEGLVAQLQNVQRTSLSDSRHGGRNILVAQSESVRAKAVQHAQSYFSHLWNLREPFPEINPFLQRVSELGLKELNPSASELNSVRLSQSISTFFEPFVRGEERRRELTQENLARYYACRDQVSGTIQNPLLKSILQEDPWVMVPLFFEFKQTSAAIEGTYREFKEALDAALLRASMPIIKVINMAEEKARHRGKLELGIVQRGNFSVDQPLRLTAVIRDLLYNVIAYGEKVSQIYVGQPSSESLQRLGAYHPLVAHQSQMGYFSLVDFGKGMSEEQITRMNEYLNGVRLDDNLSTVEGGGSGSRGLHDYLLESKGLRTVYCVYSKNQPKGTRVELFFSGIEKQLE